MKIKSITLKNFLIHEFLQVEFNQITTITGPHGSGKTSVLDALCWLITGDINRDPVRRGAKSCQVSVVFESNNGDSQIIAEQSKSLSGSPELKVEGAPGGTNQMRREWLLEWLEMTAEQAKSLLNPGYFLDLPVRDSGGRGKDRLSVIGSILGTDLTIDQLLSWLSEKQSSTNWAKALKTYLGEFDPNETQSNNKAVVALRRQLKREVADATAALEKYADIDFSIISKKAASEKRLKELEEQYAKLLEFRGAAGNAQQIERAKVRIAEIEEMLSKPDHSEEVYNLESESESLQDKHIKLQSQFAEINGDIRSAKEALERAKADLLKAESLGDNCPTCGAKITAAKKKKALDPAKDEIAARESEIKALEKSKIEIEKSIKQISGSIEIADDKREKLQAETFSGDAEALIKEADELRAFLETVSESGREVTEATISDVTASIEKGKAYIFKISEAEKAAAAKSGIEETLQEKQDELQTIETLCQAFDVKGAKAELMREALDQLNEEVERFAGLLPFGKVEFITEIDGKETFEIFVNGHPEASFSHAQRKAISTAFQLAFCSLSEFPVVLDNADFFREPLEGMVKRMLFTAKDELQIVILSAVNAGHQNGNALPEFVTALNLEGVQ